MIIVFIAAYAPSAFADLIVSNLENSGITKNDYTMASGNEKIAMGFTTDSYSWHLNSITMRLKGWNFVAPVPMTTPVELYTSEAGGQFDQPGIFIHDLGELSITSLDEYTIVSDQTIYLSPETEYWIVLSAGSFEDLYGYQGGPQIGSGYVASPSLIFERYSDNWEQAGLRTFAIEVQGTMLHARLARSTPLYYSTLQAAYDNASDGDIIQSQAEVLNEDIYFDLNKSVAIEGGYVNNYNIINGSTILNGNMVISNGTVIIDSFALGL